METMSFSRPVLVSDIPENLEVSEGVASTFRAGDASDLARALKEMEALDPAARAEMGARGMERVKKDYNWDSITLDIEKTYLGISA